MCVGALLLVSEIVGTGVKGEKDEAAARRRKEGRTDDPSRGGETGGEGGTGGESGERER